MRKGVLRDAASNYVIYGLQLATSLVAVPIYLQTYGESLYGMYLLSVGLAGSLLFLELGSGKAIVRYMAEFVQTRDEAIFASALKTCLTITLVGAVLIGGIFSACGLFVDRLFDLGSVGLSVARTLFGGAAILAVVMVLSQLTQGLVQGAALFYRRNVLSVLQVVLRMATVVAVAIWTFDIVWLIYVEVGIVLVSIGLDGVTLRRGQREIWNQSLLKQMYASEYSGDVLGYAKNTFGLSSVAFFSQHTDRLLIGSILDVSFVAIYVVVTKPYAVVKSLLSKAYTVLQPRYVALLSKEGLAALYGFLGEAGRSLGTITSCATVTIASALPIVIPYWLGTHEYDEYVIYGQIILGATGIRSYTTMLYQSQYVRGKADRLFTVEVILVGINLIISLSLLVVLGMGGVIIGSAIQFVLVGPLLLRLSRSIDGGYAGALDQVIPSYLCSVGYLAVVMGAWYGAAEGATPQRYHALVAGGAIVVLCIVIVREAPRLKRAGQVINLA